MAIQVQFRRGTGAQNDAFTGASGEITVDTSNNTLRVHNGSTTGGIILARQSDLTSVQSSISANAATAYSNAVAYVDSKVYANTSQLTANAATAYSNATSFASNASNITTGTLPWAQAPTGTVNTSGSFTITGVHTHNANLAMNSTAILTGNTSVVGMSLLNASETVNVSATAATGTVTFRVSDQAVLYYTSNATASWTPNVSFSSGTTLNNAMSNGQSISIAFLVTQGATAYFSNAINIDGTSVTPKWQGGSAPTAGNASGIDSYVYTIVKTANATYTVLASLTQFK